MLCAGLVGLGVLAVSAPLAGAAPRDFYGISSQTHLTQKDFKKMKGKVGTLRAMLSWAAIDPGPAANDLGWFGFDVLVAEAARNRIRVLPFVFGTPPWVAKDLDNRKCAGGGCAIYAPRSKAARRAWADFVGAAVDRYGPNGRFWSEHPELPKRPIRDWQLWNEANSKSFFAPRPNAKQYANMVKSASKEIKRRDRGADVVLGGLAELAGSSKAIPGPKYLRKVYRSKRVKRHFDGLAVHPYGKELRKVVGQVNRFRKVAKRSRDRNVSLWITEVGWGSARGGNPLNVGKRGQAKRLRQTFRTFERKRKRWKVKNVTWFSWRDSSQRICDWCPKSGLFTKSLKPKPAWRAYKRAAR